MKDLKQLYAHVSGIAKRFDGNKKLTAREKEIARAAYGDGVVDAAMRISLTANNLKSAGYTAQNASSGYKWPFRDFGQVW